MIGANPLQICSKSSFPASNRRIVFADVQLPEADMEETNNNRNTVTNLNFIGEVGFETGFTFEEKVGGISGLAYDRSTINDARYYAVRLIDLGDSSLDRGDVEFSEVTTLPDGR